MNCQQVMQEDIAERYLTNTLSPEDRESFERHYFACDACFAHLETLRMARQQLLARTPKRRPAHIWTMAAAIAAVIVLACGLAIEFRFRQVAPPQSSALLQLARFDPPQYRPAEMRGTTSALEMHFQSAMEPYRSGDYAEAARRLSSLLTAEPNDVRARFYLGACELLIDHPHTAADDLRRAIDAGDSPFLEESRIALAKAELRMGHLQNARRQLQLAAEMHGDFEPQARTLLSALDKVRP